MATPHTVRIRFRQTVTLGDAVYQANALETVEATAAAWALVDSGAADLEPGPGLGGQPFPPWIPTGTPTGPEECPPGRTAKHPAEAPKHAAEAPARPTPHPAAEAPAAEPRGRPPGGSRER